MFKKILIANRGENGRKAVSAKPNCPVSEAHAGEPNCLVREAHAGEFPAENSHV